VNAPQPGTREVALGLTGALLPALAADANPLAHKAAREVAALVGLPGLDAVLAELERHPGAGRPVDLDHVAQRLERLAAAANHEGSLAPFIAADAELATLAASIAATDWGAEPRGREVATVSLAETLADLRLDAPAETREARLTMNVASALRAALDWLGVEDGARLSAETSDSALSLTARAGHAGGAGPAGAVLASVEGSLGRDLDRRWILRVPRRTERPSFLLLRQGRYGLALPWHSVARLRMVGPRELDRLGEPLLDPLARPEPGSASRPAALVALGLARAWLVADRIVWRVAARPEEAGPAAPFPGVAAAVEMEGSGRYWVLDPAWMLRGVAPPEEAPPAPRPPGVPRAPVREPRAEATSPAPAIEPDEVSERLAEAVERALAVLRPERAVADAPAVAPAPEPAVPEPAPASDLDAVVDAAFSFTEPAPPETTPPPAAAPAVEVFEPAAADETFELAKADEEFDQASAEPLEPAAFDALPATGPELEPAAAATAEESPALPSSPASRPALKRVIVADDSLVARIFLARLLELRGWIVESVPDASSLFAELSRGQWELVCADFALPDAQGEEHVRHLLRAVAAIGAGSGHAPELIVLTRDAADERLARRAGAERVLRKPFEPQRLDDLLSD
jgi:CheY-like chemotaxis protein